MDHDFDDGRPPEFRTRDERRAQVLGALLKVLAVVFVIGVVIAVGTVIAVRSLGLDEARNPEGSAGTGPSSSVDPLPTTALPVPGQATGSADPSGSASESPRATTPSPKARKKGVRLEASPRQVRPGEQINLTGTYPAPATDSGVLRVQRLQDGAWADFGVDATVRGNTYATYVITQRSGEQRFRMYDPATQRSSNVVRVTVG